MRKIFLVLTIAGMLIALNRQVIKAEDVSKEQAKSSKMSNPVECQKKSHKAAHGKMAMHKEMHKSLKELAEVIRSLNEVKNNPELKQKIDTIIAGIEDMEQKCSGMLQKHKKDQEEGHSHHGTMHHKEIE